MTFVASIVALHHQRQLRKSVSVHLQLEQLHQQQQEEALGEGEPPGWLRLPGGDTLLGKVRQLTGSGKDLLVEMALLVLERESRLFPPSLILLQGQAEQQQENPKRSLGECYDHGSRGGIFYQKFVMWVV